MESNSKSRKKFGKAATVYGSENRNSFNRPYPSIAFSSPAGHSGVGVSFSKTW